MINYVSRAKFKNAPKGSAIRKELPTSSPIDLGNRQLKFTISTPDVDRSNDVIDQSGWDLRNYLRNPIVLFGHDSDSLPIGKAVSIGVENGSMMAVVEFVDATVPIAGPMAEACYQLCRDGFLSTTSVGFLPKSWTETDDNDRGANTYSAGIDYSSVELLEFSIVCVPDNPLALIEPISPLGIMNTDPLKAVRAMVEKAKRKRLMDLLARV